MANVFALPSAGKSFTLSLIDFNNSFKSLLSSFYGPSLPTSADITMSGVATAPSSGMLYRSSIFNAFYVYDPTSVKGSSIGGNFTRVGIGNRNFESISTLVSNLNYIEQSEIVTTVGAGANYRAYLRTSNSNGFVDIGIPPASSLTTSMFINRQISNTHIQASSITGNELAPNILYNSTISFTGRTILYALSEGLVTVSPVANVVTLDLGIGTNFYLNLTSNISNVNITNANTSYVSSFVLFTSGDGTQRSITWPTSTTVKFPGNTIPTPTSTSGKLDMYIGVSNPVSLGTFLVQSGGQSY